MKKNFIKIFYIIILLIKPVTGKENKILFKIDNKIFTSYDLEKRKEYLMIENRIGKDLNILEDFIAVNLFLKEFSSKKYKITDKKINEYFNLIKSNIDKMSDTSENKKIFYSMDIEIILKNIKYDFARKTIIEKLLNQKKELIFKKNENDTKNIYNYKIQIFSFQKKIPNLSKIENIIFDFSNLKLIQNQLNKYGIIYLYAQKEIKSLNQINQNLLDVIKKNQKDFMYEDQNNIYIGHINKKLKIIQNINYSLVELTSNDNINIKGIYCNNINSITKIRNINIKKIDIEYNKLNDQIKKNFLEINDFVKINDKRFVILCDINIDREILENANINDKIYYFASQIEKDFVQTAKEKYNLVLFND